MKKGKKISLLIAAGLTIAGLAVGGISGVKLGGDLRALEITPSEQKTFVSEDAIHALSIENGMDAVRLTPSADGTCTVSYADRERLTHTVTTENGVLTVRETDNRNWFDHLIPFYHQETIEICIPAGAYVSLAVADSVGDVTIPSDFIFGTAEIVSDTGDVDFAAGVHKTLTVTAQTGEIQLRSVQQKGKLVLETDTGNISVRNARTLSDAAVRTQTGRVELTDVVCRALDVQSDTGDLKLQNVEASETLRAETETGDITLERCDAAELSLRSDTGDVDGSVCTDKVFQASSETGKIRVPDTITGGRCKIMTETGDIHMRIAG